LQSFWSTTNIEKYNPQDETILIVAVRFNRNQMIKDLIVKEANLRTQDRLGRTIIEIFISRDDVEIIQFIQLQLGTLLLHDLYNKEFPLTLAVSHQSIQSIN
jgi:hypothetical protein